MRPRLSSAVSEPRTEAPLRLARRRCSVTKLEINVLCIVFSSMSGFFDPRCRFARLRSSWSQLLGIRRHSAHD